MKEDILDDFNNLDVENRHHIKRVVQISVGTIFLMLCLDVFYNYLPKNLIDWEGVQIKTLGLILFGLFIFASISIPTYLNKIQPKFTIAKVIILTVIIFFAIESLYSIILTILYWRFWDLDFEIDALTMIYRLGFATGISSVTAYFRIRYLRKKTIGNQIVLLISLLMLLSWLFGE